MILFSHAVKVRTLDPSPTNYALNTSSFGVLYQNTDILHTYVFTCICTCMYMYVYTIYAGVSLYSFQVYSMQLVLFIV